jgi:low affinity Fe/Cu permease
LQIEQSTPESISDIVDAVEKAIGEEFGYTSVSAKMQAIVFQAHYPG